MKSIGWLQVSDLHATVRRSQWSAQGERDGLRRDIEALDGTWDFVVATGDLTSYGSPEEFDRVDEILSSLCSWIPSHVGRDVAVLAVPGNHDVLRPADPPAEAMRALRDFHRDPSVQHEFWIDPESPARRTVDRALRAYARWWERRCRNLPDNIRVHQGLLPGDFTATIEVDGLRLGLAGLCSTFIQITSDDYQERLAVAPLQLAIAARGDVSAWVAAHDAAFLATHHSAHWLAGSFRSAYEETIYPEGRFLAHLSGHLHEEAAHDPARPETAEALEQGKRVALGAPSCLGLPSWETWRGERRHRRQGYNAYRLEDEGDSLRLKIWYRDLTKQNKAEPDVNVRVGKFPRVQISTEQAPSPLALATLRDALHTQHASTVRDVAKGVGVDLGPSRGAVVDLWHVVAHSAWARRAHLVTELGQVDPLTATRLRALLLHRPARPTASGPGATRDELADDLQERLCEFEPAALRAVLHLAAISDVESLGSSARIANAAIREALRGGPIGLEQLAAATIHVLNLLNPTGTTESSVPSLHSLELGAWGLAEGRVPLANKSPRNRAPTPETLERLLKDMFADLRDFDGFVLANFPAVYRRFTSVMSREARTRVLVREADPSTILAKVRRDFPSAFASHQAVLDYHAPEAMAPRTRSTRFIG